MIKSNIEDEEESSDCGTRPESPPLFLFCNDDSLVVEVGRDGVGRMMTGDPLEEDPPEVFLEDEEEGEGALKREEGAATSKKKKHLLLLLGGVFTIIFLLLSFMLLVDGLVAYKRLKNNTTDNVHISFVSIDLRNKFPLVVSEGIQIKKKAFPKFTTIDILTTQQSEEDQGPRGEGGIECEFYNHRKEDETVVVGGVRLVAHVTEDDSIIGVDNDDYRSFRVNATFYADDDDAWQELNLDTISSYKCHLYVKTKIGYIIPYRHSITHEGTMDFDFKKILLEDLLADGLKKQEHPEEGNNHEHPLLVLHQFNTKGILFGIQIPSQLPSLLPDFIPKIHLYLPPITLQIQQQEQQQPTPSKEAMELQLQELDLVFSNADNQQQEPKNNNNTALARVACATTNSKNGASEHATECAWYTPVLALLQDTLQQQQKQGHQQILSISINAGQEASFLEQIMGQQHELIILKNKKKQQQQQQQQLHTTTTTTTVQQEGEESSHDTTTNTRSLLPSTDEMNCIQAIFEDNIFAFQFCFHLKLTQGIAVDVSLHLLEDQYSGRVGADLEWEYSKETKIARLDGSIQWNLDLGDDNDKDDIIEADWLASAVLDLDQLSVAIRVNNTVDSFPFRAILEGSLEIVEGNGDSYDSYGYYEGLDYLIFRLTNATLDREGEQYVHSIGDLRIEFPQGDYSGSQNNAGFSMVLNDPLLQIAVDGKFRDPTSVFVVHSTGVAKDCIDILGGTLTMDQLRWMWSSYSDQELLQDSSGGWDPVTALKNSDGDPNTHLWSELDERCPTKEILLTSGQNPQGSQSLEQILIDHSNGRGEWIDFERFHYAESDWSVDSYMEKNPEAIGLVCTCNDYVYETDSTSGNSSKVEVEGFVEKDSAITGAWKVVYHNDNIMTGETEMTLISENNGVKINAESNGKLSMVLEGQAISGDNEITLSIQPAKLQWSGIERADIVISGKLDRNNRGYRSISIKLDEKIHDHSIELVAGEMDQDDLGVSGDFRLRFNGEDLFTSDFETTLGSDRSEASVQGKAGGHDYGVVAKVQYNQDYPNFLELKVEEISFAVDRDPWIQIAPLTFLITEPNEDNIMVGLLDAKVDIADHSFLVKTDLEVLTNSDFILDVKVKEASFMYNGDLLMQFEGSCYITNTEATEEDKIIGDFAFDGEVADRHPFSVKINGEFFSESEIVSYTGSSELNFNQDSLWSETLEFSLTGPSATEVYSGSVVLVSSPTDGPDVRLDAGLGCEWHKPEETLTCQLQSLVFVVLGTKYTDSSGDMKLDVPGSLMTLGLQDDYAEDDNGYVVSVSGRYLNEMLTGSVSDLKLILNGEAIVDATMMMELNLNDVSISYDVEDIISETLMAADNMGMSMTWGGDYYWDEQLETFDIAADNVRMVMLGDPWVHGGLSFGLDLVNSSMSFEIKNAVPTLPLNFSFTIGGNEDDLEVQMGGSLIYSTSRESDTVDVPCGSEESPFLTTFVASVRLQPGEDALESQSRLESAFRSVYNNIVFFGCDGLFRRAHSASMTLVAQDKDEEVVQEVTEHDMDCSPIAYVQSASGGEDVHIYYVSIAATCRNCEVTEDMRFPLLAKPEWVSPQGEMVLMSANERKSEYVQEKEGEEDVCNCPLHVEDDEPNISLLPMLLFQTSVPPPHAPTPDQYVAAMNAAIKDIQETQGSLLEVEGIVDLVEPDCSQRHDDEAGPSSTSAPVEFSKPVNYSHDEPVIFNQWCKELRDMYGPSCTCETTYGVSNNIYGVDLDHEVKCDPLQGNITCIEGVTVETAIVWLRATSVGIVDDFKTIAETAITDFYVFLDDTDIGTISFRFQDGIGKRRTGCQAVFGSVNCPLCGICDAPPNNRSAEVPNHLGPADIFRGISGNCRYNGNGDFDIGVFNTCQNGDNVLTNLWWNDLEVTSTKETGACPNHQNQNSSLPTTPSAASDDSTTRVEVNVSMLLFNTEGLTSVDLNNPENAALLAQSFVEFVQAVIGNIIAEEASNKGRRRSLMMVFDDITKRRRLKVSLLRDSPTVDRAVDIPCPATDSNRGVPVPEGANCQSLTGNYELEVTGKDEDPAVVYKKYKEETHKAVEEGKFQDQIKAVAPDLPVTVLMVVKSPAVEDSLISESSSEAPPDADDTVIPVLVSETKAPSSAASVPSTSQGISVLATVPLLLCLMISSWFNFLFL